ncbi:unnamed protein product [Polarella glacialis]|uniref:Concentrative nucleoside transporter N-terminal domain-containing protein n=1 Tax=Polarella glacialis TaxID=89957 RepID=A0A813G3I6_POLGL|nr:unnamed protein product [Polarella glacialis]
MAERCLQAVGRSPVSQSGMPSQQDVEAFGAESIGPRPFRADTHFARMVSASSQEACNSWSSTGGTLEKDPASWRWLPAFNSRCAVPAVLWFLLGAFLVAAWCHDPSQAWGPTVAASCVLLFHLWTVYEDYSGKDLDSWIVVPATKWAGIHPCTVRSSAAALAVAVLISWILLVVKDDPYRLVPAVGLLMLVLITWCFSTDRSAVVWRPVLWGIGMQLFLGLVILRTKFGYEAFRWLGEQVADFLACADEGSRFVFGPK